MNPRQVRQLPKKGKAMSNFRPAASLHGPRNRAKIIRGTWKTKFSFEKHIWIFPRPVSSNPSTCLHWLWPFVLLSAPLRNFHLRDCHTPAIHYFNLLSVSWKWDKFGFGKFPHLIPVFGSIAEEVAAHFTGLLNLQVGHLNRDEGVAQGKQHDAGLDGDLAQEGLHLPHHLCLAKAHTSLKHQGQVGLHLTHHSQPLFPEVCPLQRVTVQCTSCTLELNYVF